MRYFWLLDRVSQSQFLIYWDKGENNHADYYTKHHSPSYHQQIRPTYILKGYHLPFHSHIHSNIHSLVLPARVCFSPYS